MQIAFTMGGGIVGGFFGAPELGMAAGAILGQLLFPGSGKHQYIEGPRLNDLQVTSGSYGLAIPDVYGSARLAGNVIWTAGIVEHKHVSEQEEGKGGPSQTTTQITYTYTCSFALGICKGEIDNILRIWANGMLIYTANPANTGAASKLNFTLYTGSSTQSVDPIMEANKGAGNVPAYRDLAYIVFEDLDLTNYGNRLPNINFEVVKSDSSSYPVVEVEIDSQTNIEDCVVTDDGEYMIIKSSAVAGKLVQKVDLINNIFVGSVNVTDAQGEGRLGVDELGNAYLHTPGDADSNRVAKYGPSMILVTESDLPAGGGNKHQGVNVIADRTSDFVWSTGYYMYGFYPRPSIALYNKSNLLWRWTAHFGGDEASIMGEEIDPNHKLWILETSQYQAPFGTWLYRFNPYTEQNDGGGEITALVDGNTDLDRFVYDPITQYFWVANHDGMWTLSYEEGVGFSLEKAWGSGYDSRYMFRIKNGKLWVKKTIATDVYYVEIDCTQLEESGKSYAQDLWVTPPSDSFTVRVHDPISKAFWGNRSLNPPRVAKQLYDRATSNEVTLSSIVDDICSQVGLTNPADVNTATLTDNVIGYVRDKQMTARKAIEPLQSAFQFDAVESDGKIKFVKRGSASVVTISNDELATHDDGQDMPPRLTHIRMEELELPNQMEMTYIDYTTDYLQNIQRARRLITESTQIDGASLPIVMTASTAKRIAEILLGNTWIDRDNYDISIPTKYLYLEPTDVITVNSGRSYIMRAAKMYVGASFVININALAEDSASYTSAAVGTHGEIVPSSEISYPGTTVWALIDNPLLRDAENYSSPLGYYIAGTGKRDAWHGAQVFRSKDGAISFVRIVPILESAIIGYASDALGEVADPWVWDNGHTVTVLLETPDAELDNCTEAQALEGTNWFLLGNSAVGWELCSFTVATLNSDGSYTLSGLLRGLRGTDWMCGLHSGGDIFILPSVSTIARVNMDSGDLGAEYFYKAVSFGMNFETGQLRSFTNLARGSMPYSPVHIDGSRDISNNLTITWIRRTRIMGEWQDSIDAPLGEDSESYEIDIYDGATIVRTIAAATETASYTAVQQTADGLTPGDPVILKAYQLSAQVGRGFPRQATV